MATTVASYMVSCRRCVLIQSPKIDTHIPFRPRCSSRRTMTPTGWSPLVAWSLESSGSQWHHRGNLPRSRCVTVVSEDSEMDGTKRHHRHCATVRRWTGLASKKNDETSFVVETLWTSCTTNKIQSFPILCCNYLYHGSSQLILAENSRPF